VAGVGVAVGWRVAAANEGPVEGADGGATDPGGATDTLVQDATSATSVASRPMAAGLTACPS
jgi:hypothetical protein